MDLGLYILRLTQIFRSRPSRQWLIALVAVIVVATVLVTIERTVGWPDWLRANHGPRVHLPSAQQML